MVKARFVKMRKLLDASRRHLLVNDVDYGGYLSESVWGILDLLAELRPRRFDQALPGDGVLAYDHAVGGRIRACHARRELERQLPQGIAAKYFVQTLRERGYRLRSDVRIRGRGEVGLSICRDEALPEPAQGQQTPHRGGERHLKIG